MPRKVLVTVTMLLAAAAARGSTTVGAQHVTSGFDDLTNGYVTQEEFDAARLKFEEIETAADGLGPMYNAPSCAACHASPVTGGAGQISEVRAGHLDATGRFVPAAGGSLIRDRAILPAIQAHVSDVDDIRGLRITSPVLGLGYIEAIDDSTFIELAAKQAAATDGRIAGQIVTVPVLEADGVRRVGRFGWKNQHASLLSFAGDAYLNEMGITNRLAPFEIEAPFAPPGAYDTAADPEDAADRPIGSQDIDTLATFIRATKAPARDMTSAASPEAHVGAQIFRAVGCAVCHTETLHTAPAGTPLNGGTYVVPLALGHQIIHPFSDFLLHDVATGDGIPQGSATGALFRTAPLWGLRTRTRLMHDGMSLTLLDAVARHGGEAAETVRALRRLDDRAMRQLIAFLRTL